MSLLCLLWVCSATCETWRWWDKQHSPSLRCERQALITNCYPRIWGQENLVWNWAWFAWHGVPCARDYWQRWIGKAQTSPTAGNEVSEPVSWFWATVYNSCGWLISLERKLFLFAWVYCAYCEFVVRHVKLGDDEISSTHLHCVVSGKHWSRTATRESEGKRILCGIELDLLGMGFHVLGITGRDE